MNRIHVYAILGHFEGIQELIKHDVDVNDKDGYGWTAMMHACDRGHEKIVKLLLENDANVNEQNNRGYTALMNATVKNNMEIVELLLKHGANVDIKDEDGKTAYDHTYNEKLKKILKNIYNSESI